MKYSARVLFVIIAILFINCKNIAPLEPVTLFVGTYTDTDSKGIYSYRFDSKTGMLSEMKLQAELPSPSFVKISPDKNYLYAVQETNAYDSLGGGGVSAFAIKNKQLELLNSRSTSGAHPCHISISSDGKKLAVSNYTGGNLAEFNIENTGSLSTIKNLIEHKVIDSTRIPHVHSSLFRGSNLFVADLGLDALKRYARVDDSYVQGEQSSIDFAKGDGPRHFTFSVDGKFMYVINEHSSTISIFQKNDTGAYMEIGRESTLSPDFKGDSYCADIHLSADGKFLYGSNRGENSIVVFEVDETSGNLNYIETVSVQGDWPRNFTIDPSGKFLLVANQKSDNITVFSRDDKNGKLNFLHEVSLPMPVCLEFL